MPTFKARLVMLGKTQIDLREEMSKRGASSTLANVSRICNGRRSEFRIDREIAVKEVIEKILKEWEKA